MAKKSSSDECFLCGQVGKGRQFQFYSGLCKAGSTTRLMMGTIKVLDRWRELRIYEVFVCRACQLQLWSAWSMWPPIWYALGIVPLALLSLVSILLLPLIGAVLVGGTFGIAALALAGASGWHLIQHLAKKPKRERLELLVLKKAMDDLPAPGDHTFLTVEQYLDLVRMGIID